MTCDDRGSSRTDAVLILNFVFLVQLSSITVEKLALHTATRRNERNERENKKDADGGRDDDGLGNGVLGTRCVRDRDVTDGLIN